MIIDAQTAFEKNKTIALGITNLFDKEQKLFIGIDKSGGIFKEQPIYLFDKVTAESITSQKKIIVLPPINQ